MSGQKPSGLRNPGAAVRGVGAGTLVLQSVVLLLALAPLARIGGEHKTAAMWFCAALVVASVVLAGLLRHDWAWWAGLALPLTLIAGGLFLHWSLSAVGILFGLLWVYVLSVRRSVLRGRSG